MDLIFLKSLRPLYCDYISRILCVRRRPLCISTRAPTRGASPSAVMVRESLAYFYSRPYARGDMRRGSTKIRPSIFLLTPLREGRPAQRMEQQLPSEHFYSRPYARGDHFCLLEKCDQPLFLLTPLREGRQQFFTKPQVDLYDKLLKNSHFLN